MGMGRFVVAGVAVAATMGSVAACGSSDDTASDAKGGTVVDVVASTDVWGDVVAQVAGDLAGSTVRISSIITDPDADPHSYEANTQNQLALSKADLVVENGGGYDDFVDSMLKSAGNDDVTLLNAVEISGKTAPAGGELNEHVWYDFPTVEKVAAGIRQALAEADPAHASAYAANEKRFDRALAAMEATEALLLDDAAGREVIVNWGTRAGRHWVSVLDRGEGLPEQTAELFERGVTLRDRGSGLGLTTATRAARSLGGTVELAPNEQAGTTATFSWPVEGNKT